MIPNNEYTGYRDRDTVCIDFETYYSDKYNLRTKGISNTEYIRDPQFKIHMAGIKINEGPTSVYSEDDMCYKLANIDWKNSNLLCHHTQFDGFILKHWFNIVPAFYLCTLSMARAYAKELPSFDLDTVAKSFNGKGKIEGALLDIKNKLELHKKEYDELAKYCVRDVEETYNIYSKIEPAFPPKEMHLIHHTIKAYTDPILNIDFEQVQKVETLEKSNKQQAIESVGLENKSRLTSRNKFAELLKEVEPDIEIPTKVSNTTQDYTFAFAKTDLGFQKLQEHENPKIRQLVEARLIVQTTQEEKRAQRLLSHSNNGERALPIYLGYATALTNRWSGGDKMNPQNLGRDSLLRKAIIAPPKHKLVIFDSAQIEARVNAWISGEIELLEDFRKGVDIYSKFAAEEIYHKPIKDITEEERFLGKVSILALGYSMGKDTFDITLRSGVMGAKILLDITEASQIVFKYRRKFSRIKAFWNTCNDKIIPALKYGKVVTLKEGNIKVDSNYTDFGSYKIAGGIHLSNGLILKYPNLKYHASDGWVYGKHGKKIYGGLLAENIVQAIARNIVAEQILPLANKYRVVLMVHDEVVLCVPEEDSKGAFEDAHKAFNTPPSWCPELPVAGKGEISDFYTKP